MSVLSDNSIRDRFENGDLEIENIANFEQQLQPASLDLRVGYDYLEVETDTVRTAAQNAQNKIVVEPNTFYLMHTVESLSLPNDIQGRVAPRASVSFDGLSVSSGLIHPGYEGVLKVGLYNQRESTRYIDPDSRLIQVEFVELDVPVDVEYGDQHTQQYQHQQGL